VLIAKLNTGEHVDLTEAKWTKQGLSDLRNKHSFYCPGCHSSLQLKLGNKRSWHFSHLHNRCSTTSEPETPYHLEGKKLLLEWFRKQSIIVQLEPYLAKIKQRPDLLAQAYHSQYAIEFQCSTITPALYQNRTMSFLNQSIIPLWILGGNRIQRHKNYFTFRLSIFDWMTARCYPHKESLPHIFFFCPEKQQFALLSNFTPLTSTSVIASITYQPLSDITFQDLMTPTFPNQGNLTERWLSIKRQWRINAFRNKMPAMNYLKKVYMSINQPVMNFPPEAGLPTPYMYHIDTPSYLWQTWILTTLIDPVSLGSPIAFQNIYHAFQRMVKKGLFQTRILPLIENSHYSFAIMKYLEVLSKLGILAKTGGSSFVKSREIRYPKSIEDALIGDRKTWRCFEWQKNQR
jgi:competence protein CoiA